MFHEPEAKYKSWIEMFNKYVNTIIVCMSQFIFISL